MKEKDSTNVEDILAPLNNSRTQQPVLISLYNKLSSAKISNVQRNRLMKTVASHLKDGSSTDLQVAALTSIVPAVHSVSSASSNAVSGADYHVLEACLKIVEEHVANSSSQHIDVVAKALEIISLTNAATVSKLFSQDKTASFKKIMSTYLNLKDLRCHALTLLAMGLSVPQSECLAKTILEDMVPLIQLVYPLIFNVDDKNVHSAALKIMKEVKLSTKPQPFWNQLKEQTQKDYCKRMVEMVNAKANWPEVWKCIVNLFGEELHSGGQLINHMLEVLERAFKHSDFEWTRVQAFECWNTLIDNFKTGLKNRKRIDLIMIPLKANNHRIETLALAKLRTYDHLLATLGKDLVSSPDILTHFLTFCFGSEKTSCPPVKSYPRLHDRCVECIRDILVSPYGKEMFKNSHKELVTAVGECFVMENASEKLLSQLWDRLLELVCEREGTDAVKTLFNMVNSLVVRAGNKELNGSLKLQLTMSPPSKSVTNKLHESLGHKIAVIIIRRLLQGPQALPSKLLKMRSLYVGSCDVMNGTPTLLLMEWLSSPSLMLGAGDLPKYNELISKILAIHCEELSGFVEFTQLILKKLLVFDENLALTKKMLMYQYTTAIWCTLAKELVKFIQNDGSVNQGDAAEHDFSAMYSVLLFPVECLHNNMDLIEKCADPWSDLFYEVCQQAELVPTASLQLLCEQVCIRLVSVSKKDPSPTQVASIYMFLTCVLEVSFKRFKSKKSFKWVQQHLSVILREMNDLAIDQDVIFNQATKCIQHCLKQTPITAEIVENVSPIVCLLLQRKTSTSGAAGKLNMLLSALKEASLFIHQHGFSKESVNGMLQKVSNAGKNHSSQEIRSAVDDLLNTFSEKVSDEEGKSLSIKSKTFSPSSHISFSPKQASKKFPTVQMSPSNLSPGGTKRKLQTTVCNSEGKFVRIETPPKKIILTEHQKEVRRERRQDIPALYQDLSQDTQSMSQDSTQDFVALPPSPKGKPGPVLDEDAVMDIDHLNTSLHASAKKMASPKSSKKSHVSEHQNEKSFTPPVGFILPSVAEDAKSVTNADNQHAPSGFKPEILTGKENENASATPTKSVKSSKTLQKGTLTRSSSNKISLTTRSGKIVKRTSLAPETEVQKTRKSSRNSLPSNFSEEQMKKGSVESVVLESDTDTESVSSIASETCTTGSKVGKTSLRSGRSIKREVSLESDTEIISVKGSKNATDGLENNILKPISSDKEATNSKDSKSDSEDVPLSKLVGRKMLTRSHSNSSLEGAPPSRKLKSPSPDSKDKAMSPIAESNSPPKETPQQSECKSPPTDSCKKTLVPSIEVSPTDKRKHNNDRLACDSPTLKGLEKSVTTMGDAQIISKAAKTSGSPWSVKRFTLSSDGGKDKNKAVSSSSSPSKLVKMNLIDSGDNNDIEIVNGTQDSQEIIESSQEPMLKCLKPCLVGLERFRCTEANEKVQFENLTIESGPSPTSPYKILTDAPADAVKPNSACRRSLLLEDTGKPSGTGKEVASSPKSSTVPQVEINKSPPSAKQISVSDEMTSDHVLKKLPCNLELEKKSMIKNNLNKEDMEKDLSTDSEVNPQVRNDSMPEWMHDKKDSPLSKRIIRSASARTSFMKSVTDNGISTSPPKAVDVSPISSPVQSKRLHKSSGDSTTTPIIKRSSRAAQLLGLGQAAAARGGDTVISSASRSLRLEKTSENEESETPGTNGNSIPSSSAANSVLASVATVSTPVASPSVRRHKLLDLESLKSTPQKCLEDKGNKEDWVPRDWTPMATPDTSILKRKREIDSDAPSPSVKRKRVSFRDPPLSKLLRFGETSEGTVFTSDQPTGTDKVSDADSVKCSAETEEVEVVEQLEQLCECPGNDSESKLKENSPQKQKDPLRPVENSTEKNSPQKSDSVAHDREGMEVVGEGSPKKAREELSGRGGKRKTESAHEMEGIESMSDDEPPQENGSEQSEVETQNNLDDLHRMPSFTTPICLNLAECTHPVELISSKLTSAVWKKSLLRELSERGIRTVGDLARLTEEQLDRLPVKPPKRTNVCCVLEDFEKQHPNLMDVNTCKLLTKKSTLSDSVQKSQEDILMNASYEDIMKALSKSGTKSDFCQTFLQSLTPKDLMKVVNLEDFIKFFNLEDIAKFIKLEDLVKLYKPEDLVKLFKPKDLVKHFKTEDVINSLRAEEVAQAVGLNSSIVRSLPVDICAEAYISQVTKSSGSNEKDMSVEQLTSILNRVAGGTIQSTIFPTVPSILSTVYTDTMRDYVTRECSPTEIVQKLDEKKAKDCALQLLPKLKPKEFAQSLDSTQTAEFSAELLPKLSPSAIAEHIDDDKLEETVKALLSKLNGKRSLKFLLEQSVNVFNQLD